MLELYSALITIATCVLTIIIIVKKIRKKEVNNQLKIMLLILFTLFITNVSAFNVGNKTLNERIDIWQQIMCFTMYVLSITMMVKKKNKSLIVFLLLYTIVKIVGIINSFQMRSEFDYLFFEILMYFIFITILVIIGCIKKNKIVIGISVIFVSLYVLSMLLSIQFWGWEAVNVIVPMIGYGAVIGIIVFILIKKRILSY